MLSSSFGHHLFVERINVDDEDWAARSQAQLCAVKVGRIVVAPPWDANTATVIIRPSMGFGTGHHATTRLALKALQQIPISHRTVLDIGCGSGVLAIAAVKLGARSAVGIDIDPDALANAVDNLALNHLDGQVRFEEGDFRKSASPADIVLANLTGGLLERSAERLADLVKPHGHLIVSGFMESEKEPVLAALSSPLQLHATDQEDEWMGALLQRRHW